MRSIRFAVLGLVIGVVAAGLVPAMAAPPPSGTASGVLEVTHGDHFGDDHRHHWHATSDTTLPDMTYWLREGTVRTRLDFPTPPDLLTGTALSVTGERRDGRIAVSSYRVQAAAGGSKGGGGGTTTSWNGPRDTLVLNFTLPGTSAPTTPDTLRGAVFTDPDSVSNYLASSSYGSASLKGKNDGLASDKDAAPGDVTQWYALNVSTSNCDTNGWASAAQNAAAADGWDLSGYEHIIHVFPRTSVCGWRGLGQLGGTYTWINGIEPALNLPLEGLIGHEIGHNLTLYHSRTWECTGSDGVRVSIARSCDYKEYGDRFEIMGSDYRHLNARNTPRLGWVPTANIALGANGATYTLSPIESPATGLQVLRVSRGRKLGYVYVEARTSDLPFDTSTTKESGALIHTGMEWTRTGNSYLVDGSPGTAHFEDAPLGAGEAFVDTVTGVYIEVVSVNADGSVTVLVRTGQSNAAPAASSTGGHAIETGAAHTHDGATASDSNKNLASYKWTWTSCPSTCPTLTSDAGTLGGGNASVPGPTFTPTDAGNYTLTLTVWDAAGARATTQVTETASHPVVTPSI